jgi:hypothetical protein
VEWKRRYEITTDKRDVTENTPPEKLRTKPHEYIKLKVFGHVQGTKYRRMLELGWKPGEINELAVFGFFCKLLELAGDQADPTYRGYILDVDQRPMTVKQIAEELSIQESGRLSEAMAVLLELNWIEQVEYPTQINKPQSENVDNLCENRQEGGVLQNLQKFAKIASKDLQNLQTLQKGLQTLQKENESEDKENITKRDCNGPISPSTSIFQEGLSASDSTSSLQVKKAKTEAQLKFPLRPRTESDKTLLAAVFNQAEQKVLEGIAEVGIFDQLLEAAAKCSRADNPWAMFNSMVNEPWFGYQRQKRSGFFGKVFARK